MVDGKGQGGSAQPHEAATSVCRPTTNIEIRGRKEVYLHITLIVYLYIILNVYFYIVLHLYLFIVLHLHLYIIPNMYFKVMKKCSFLSPAVYLHCIAVQILSFVCVY